MNIKLILIAGLVVLCIYNVYASYRCLNSEYSDAQQKVMQFFLVWLLPVFGAAIIIHFSSKPDEGPNYKSHDASPGDVNVGAHPNRDSTGAD